MSDEEALVRRALAAGRRAREEREAQEEERERFLLAEEARRKAEETADGWQLREAAVGKLEEILGHHTSPHDWEIQKVREQTGTWLGSAVYEDVPYATITILGVSIRGKRSGNDIKMEMLMPVGRYVLTLATFGEMLERLHGEQ